MSITVLKEGETIRILKVEGELPSGQPVRLFTREEIESELTSAMWSRLPEETRETLAIQTQSASYAEWMDEDEWEESCRLREAQNHLPLSDFIP